MSAANIQITDRFVTLAEGEIFARAWSFDEERGKQSPPIVLLHDSLGCVELWGDVPYRLADATGRSVIAYDRLGFGRSSARSDLPSVNFILEEATTYFPRIIDHLGISNFCLFGHSVGGGMAVAIASQSHEACKAVISESAQAFVEDVTLRGIKAAREKFENTSALEKLKRLHGDKAQWVVSAWIDVWLSPEFADWNLKHELANVSCPMLIIHGDRDEYGSAKFPETLRDHSAGETQMVILPDCGHVPHREQTDAVLALTKSFLNQDRTAAHC